MNKLTLYLLMLLVALGGLCASCTSDDDVTNDSNTSTLLSNE